MENPRTEASRQHTHREYQTIPTEPSDRSRSLPRDSPYRRNKSPFEPLRQSADLSLRGSHHLNNSVQLDNLGYNPNPRGQSKTPHPYMSQDSQFAPAKVIDPLWKKDYLFIKNKNGSYGNPINIITNEYKPYAGAL